MRGKVLRRACPVYTAPSERRGDRPGGGGVDYPAPSGGFSGSEFMYACYPPLAYAQGAGRIAHGCLSKGVQKYERPALPGEPPGNLISFPDSWPEHGSGGRRYRKR